MSPMCPCSWRRLGATKALAVCRLPPPSLAPGTVLQNTKTPLTLWFWAAYLMTNDKRGVSALLFQRQLGLRRYETAWMMLHKLRRATVNFAREPLRGEVEMDETWVGDTQAGLRGSRQLKGRRAALVLVAVEKRGEPRDVFAWPSSRTSGRRPSTASSPRTWLPVPRSIPMASRASAACKKSVSSTFLARNRSEPNCAAAPSLWSPGRSRHR